MEQSATTTTSSTSTTTTTSSSTTGTGTGTGTGENSVTSTTARSSMIDSLRGCGLSGIRIDKEELRRRIVIPQYLRLAMRRAINSKHPNAGVDSADLLPADDVDLTPDAPMVVFINSRSGGRHGPELMLRLQQLLSEEQLVISMIRSRAMEAKFKRKGSILRTENYSFIHPTSGELFVSTGKQKQENSNVDEEVEEFASVKSSFSSSFTLAAEENNEAFFSVKTNFSCCSSLKELEFAENKWWVSEVVDSSEIRRRAIIQEVCHCEGWPFGLCRKALLLPPLPKSPSECWSWCKGHPKDLRSSRNINNRLIESYIGVAF